MIEKNERTFERYREALEHTSITEKLDYKSLLIGALGTVETSILSGETEMIEAAIWTLYNMIPAAWHNDNFKDAVKKCKVTERQDVRPLVAGTVRLHEDVCKRLGVPAFKEVERTDYYALLNACVNLLEQLGVLMRRTPKAWLSGKSGYDPTEENRVRQLE